MLNDPASKYRAFAPIGLKDRAGPDVQIARAAAWLAPRLRDGNQALITRVPVANTPATPARHKAVLIA